MYQIKPIQIDQSTQFIRLHNIPVAIASSYTPAPGNSSDASQRRLAGRQLQQSDLCAGPQANATVTLEGYDNAAAVERALANIMSGATWLPVDDSTSASDTICTAETKLEMMAPATDVLDENNGKPDSSSADKKKSASVVIGAVLAAVGVLLILFVSVMALRRRRGRATSSVHPH